MSLTFLNLVMLAGMLSVLIPPIIHLLNRRRFDVIDWGAMQFLQISQKTRRRLLIEELLLMLMRMGLIALMVLALAAPLATSELFSTVGARNTRDVVLVIDGSASMSYAVEGRTAQQAAIEWTEAFLNTLIPGDRVAILQAKQKIIGVQPNLTSDIDQARTALVNLPGPRGGADWPTALQESYELLKQSTSPQREIVFLTDNQRHGWADENALLRWELLATKLNTDSSENRPRVWVVNVAKDRPADAASWSVAPIRTTRSVVAVNRELVIRSALRLHGDRDDLKPPDRVKLEIDGRPVAERRPTLGRGDKGQVPITFPNQRFTTPGSHLVTVRVDQDTLPGANRQDYAIEAIKELPVLIVDGETRSDAGTMGSRFLLSALTPDSRREPNPAVRARVLPIASFDAGALARPVSNDADSVPRVLVLSNVAELSPAQNEAVERFLAGGGGVLVTLGERVQANIWNERAFRGGEGWLPARLIEPVGDETNLAAAVRPQPASFFHPVVEIFREAQRGSLGDAYFPRHWRVEVTPPSPATKIALVTGNEPLLVERPQGKGRVLLATVPLDDGWRTNLTELPAYPLLAHELVFYLAGSRSTEFNLQPGQPIRYRPAGDAPPSPVTIQPPEGDARTIAVEKWPFTYAETREPGIYKLTPATGSPVFFVVRSDARESDLTATTEADREKVKQLLPPDAMQYTNELNDVVLELNRVGEQQELWWLFMLGVIVLLCSEVWMTRRLAMSSGK